MSHTPGPWLHRGKSDSVHQPCDTHPYGQMIFQFHDEFGPNDDDLALILEAPNLLRVLSSLITTMRRPPTGINGYHESDVGEAEHIIARARGGK